MATNSEGRLYRPRTNLMLRSKIMKHILIALFLFLFASAVYANEIAITFDELPGQQDELAQNQRVINERILQALKKFNAPTIGFVNEGKLYSKRQESEKIAILKLWVDDGHLAQRIE